MLLTPPDSKALAQCQSFIAESKLFPFWGRLSCWILEAITVS